MEISMDQGFKLLQTYCDLKTELRVKGSVRGDFAESKAMIIDASPSFEEVCFKLFEELEGPNWLCKISLSGARFWLDPTGGPQRASNSEFDLWWSLIRIQNHDGSELLLGENLTKVQ